MIRGALLDTGPLVALLNSRDPFHPWAHEQAQQVKRPILTCEPVLAEAFHLLQQHPAAQEAILTMLQEDILHVAFALQEHTQSIGQMLKRYANVPMSLADACLVRMSELAGEGAGTIMTLDTDFRVYRRHHRQRIPVLMPPGR